MILVGRVFGQDLAPRPRSRLCVPNLMARDSDKDPYRGEPRHRHGGDDRGWTYAARSGGGSGRRGTPGQGGSSGREGGGSGQGGSSGRSGSSGQGGAGGRGGQGGYSGSAGGPGRGGSGRGRSGRGGQGGPGPVDPYEGDVPYNVYRSRPRGPVARLRGQSDFELEEQELSRTAPPRGSRGRDSYGSQPPGSAPPGSGRGRRRGFMHRPLLGLRGLTLMRLLKTVVAVIVGWLLLSVVLFFISASRDSGNLPSGAKAALTGGGPMLVKADNVLVLGLDNRPTTGYSSKEGGANYSEKDANTDTIMIWRIGGGVSRRLSIPRDTLVDLPGYGHYKINAAWQLGGPAETIKAVESLTGLQINHMIVVDLGNFPKFINDIGGVTVKTPRICSQISGGAADGGYTLNLKPGVHHLNGDEALTLARTRENSCNAAYNDISREKMQQQIMNAMRSQLKTFHTFTHLPWAAWDAPGVIQTDMGGLSLLQLFASSEIGGNSTPRTLNEASGSYNGEDVLVPRSANVTSEVNVLLHGK